MASTQLLSHSDKGVDTKGNKIPKLNYDISVLVVTPVNKPQYQL
jgi:hypothetical protein